MDISDVGEKLFADAQRFLQCDAGDDELRAVCYNSLCSLGFDLERLASLPIGVFLDPSVMRQALLRTGVSPEQIVASGLIGDRRVAKRLIGPIRNPAGRIINFWARHPEGLPPKYLFFHRGWRNETPAFGLDVALSDQTAGECEILLVEDILDALLLQSAGLPQVAASLPFARNLTPTKWEHLAALGIDRVTLVPSDEQGLERAMLARDASLQANLAPEVFVLLPESFGHVRNLAKMIRETNGTAFWSWVRDNRIPRTDDLPAIPPPTEPEANIPAVLPELPPVDQDLAEMPEAEAIEPLEAPMLEPARTRSEICPLHHCDPMFCFCWD